MEKFISPQTNSEYEIEYNNKPYILCHRKINSKHSRVRIQANSPKQLHGIQLCLYSSSKWSSVKDGDHISIDVRNTSLPNVIADAVRAIFSVIEAEKIEPIFTKIEEEDKLTINNIECIPKPEFHFNDDFKDAMMYIAKPVKTKCPTTKSGKKLNSQDIYDKLIDF